MNTFASALCSCGFELMSGATCFQCEELSVFLVRQVCYQQILSFCLRMSILPSILKDSFAGYRILGQQIFFSLGTLNVLSHCLWPLLFLVMSAEVIEVPL